MQPLLAGPGSAAVYLALSLSVGGLLAALLGLSGALTWPEAVLVAIPMAGAYSFVCQGAYYLARAVPLRLAGLARLAGTHLGAAVVSASLWVLAGRAWVEALARLGVPARTSGEAPFAPSPAASYARAAPIVFAVGLLVFLLALALHHLVLAMEASQEAETRALEFQLRSRETELRTLRSQLHPHFLFNSLNSINALIGTDAERARRTCVELGDLLRRSLTLGARDQVPFSEELALAEGLLAMEKVRFGSRLEVVVRVSEASRSCLVPPLLLQPLVENAVTHGIARLLEGGTIRIEAERHGDRLELLVENPYDPESASRKGTGLGLDNVRKRVAAFYGGGAALRVHRDAGRFRVELSLPLEDEPPREG